MKQRSDALDRTLCLMRDHVNGGVPDEKLIAQLSNCRVVFVADDANASSRHGQVALITGALLCARMGMDVAVAAKNVPLVGAHAPLTGSRLLDALMDVGGDLIPGSAIVPADPCARADLCALVGDTPASSGT
ncbi:MAG: hypothetical protein ACRDGM_14285, partial [bacterium]